MSSSDHRIITEFRGGIHLYGFQEETLRNLIHIETEGVADGARGRAALTEPFGSGKTFILLALIRTNPLPPLRPVVMYFTAEHDRHLMELRPTANNQIIRPTAIIVSRAIFGQWDMTISRHTSLRGFRVSRANEAQRLVEYIKNGTISDYDVVLIKHGKTDVEVEKKRTMDCKISLCDLINRHTFPLFWARAIYDDVELIARSACLRAISSIFVTGATNSAIPIVAERPYNSHVPLSTIARYVPAIGHPSIMQPKTRRIWTRLGHTSSQIIAERGELPAIISITCFIPNREIHRVTRLMDGTEFDSGEVLRMIHEDAMVSAAKALRISVVTPSAMLAGILGAGRDDYITVRARRTILRGLPLRGAGPDVEWRARLEQFLGENADDIAHAERPALGVRFSAREMAERTREEISETMREIDQFIARMERSFERVRENFADQACQICYAPFEDQGVAIMRCCGLVICTSCCGRAGRFEVTDGKLIGLCAQCRAHVELPGGVVVVERGNEAMDLVARAKDARELPPPLITAPSGSSPERITSKNVYVCRLIAGRTTQGIRTRRAIDGLAIPGLLEGTREIPTVGPRKFLICGSFNETIDDLAAMLCEEDIRFGILYGTVHDYARVIDAFSRDLNVLLINGTTQFAGMNLQMATDIIVMDRERAPHVGQLIGRAQRMGRVGSLTVHFLEYVAE